LGGSVTEVLAVSRYPTLLAWSESVAVFPLSTTSGIE